MNIDGDSRTWERLRERFDELGELAPTPRLDDAIRVGTTHRGTRLRLAGALLGAVLALGGAALLAIREFPRSSSGAGEAPAACLTIALNDHGRVAAFFDATVGAIRTVPAARNNEQLATYASDQSASLCYIDGQIPKAPAIPPGLSATVPPPFDRAVLVVIGPDIFMVAAGYQQNLPIQAP